MRANWESVKLYLIGLALGILVTYLLDKYTPTPAVIQICICSVIGYEIAKIDNRRNR